MYKKCSEQCNHVYLWSEKNDKEPCAAVHRLQMQQAVILADSWFCSVSYSRERCFLLKGSSELDVTILNILTGHTDHELRDRSSVVSVDIAIGASQSKVKGRCQSNREP